MSENYIKNMEVIKKFYPDLARWIEEQPDQDWIKPEGDNQLHVSVGTIFHTVYDKDNPLKGLEEVDKVPLHKENVTVIIGIGMGHVLNRICEKSEKGHHILIVEPVAHMVRLTLNRYDLSKHIESGLVYFIPGEPELDMITGLLEGRKAIMDWNVLIDKSTGLRHEYQKITAYTAELLNQIQCNTGTITSAGKNIADNDIATLPWVIRHRGVIELVGLFKGKPAVCVSTGPSLARNIHLLKEVQDKVIIVAVGQALRPLLAYDIRPDFICTVDFGEVNMTHFDGLLDETVPLVTINKAYAPLLKAYKGPKFISAGSYADTTAHSILNSMGELPQGGSVAHMVFGLAAVMGCNPVMFMGQDLALGDASHFNQADSMGNIYVENGMIKWKVDDPRSKTLHGREDITMGPAQYVPGWWGGEVLTNMGLLTFITAMQRLVSQFEGQVYNCTEGGCHIEGTKRMFLADALDKFCNEPIDKSALTPILSLHPEADSRIDTAVPLLKKDIEQLNTVIREADLAMPYIFKVRNTKNEAKLQKFLFKNYTHSQACMEASSKIPTVSLAIFWARRKIMTRELNVKQNINYISQRENRKDLLTRAERNEIILKAARESAIELKKVYENTLYILEQYQHERETGVPMSTNRMCLLDPTGELSPPNLTDAEHYLSIGNFAKPLLEAKRIVNSQRFHVRTDSEITKAFEVITKAQQLRDDKTTEAIALQIADHVAKKDLIPQYLDFIDESRKHGLAEEMDKALELLKKAAELMPDREDGQWGYASALFHCDKFEEAKTAYEKLIADHPENNRYKFELGQVMIIGKLGDGIKHIKEAMSNTEEFDYFYGAIGDLYLENGMEEEAKAAYGIYLLKFPADQVRAEKLAGLKA